MKKIITTAMLSLGVMALAQSGNVGINTERPSATLEVGVTNVNKTNNTNQGFIAPRLSKVRVANIAQPVQGTLVYVLDENTTEYPNSLISAYTGSDAKVADINEKGYYFYNGTKWVKTSGATGIGSTGRGPFNVIGTNNAATENTQDIYQMGRVAIGTNTISNPTAQMEIASRGSVPLVLRTNSEYSGLILRNMENAYAGISVGPNGSAYITSTQNGQEGIKGIKLTSAAEGSNVMIGDRILNDSERSKSKLDVQGNIVARGLGTGIVEAYIGGDEVPADNSRRVVDVEVGSVKAGVTDVTLYNPTDNKAMNLFVADVKSSGNITSNSLAGQGVRNVVADIDGRLVARRNIRTVDGLRDTLIPGDNFGYVYVTTNTTHTITITVPSNLPAGFSCVIVQKGPGQVIVQGQGVTLETARGTKTRARYSAIGVIKDTSNTATITGDAVN